MVWLTGSCIYCFIDVIRTWLKREILLSNAPPWIVCLSFPQTHSCSTVPLNSPQSNVIVSNAEILASRLYYTSTTHCLIIAPWTSVNHSSSSQVFPLCLYDPYLLWWFCREALTRLSTLASLVQWRALVVPNRVPQAREGFLTWADLCWLNPSLWHLHVYFCPWSHHNGLIEASHCAHDGSALKTWTGDILPWQSPVEVSVRIWPRPAASLWEKQPILVQTTPPVKSTDLGSPLLFPTSEFLFVACIRAVRGDSSMPQLTLLMREEGSSKLREVKLNQPKHLNADKLGNKDSHSNRALNGFLSVKIHFQNKSYCGKPHFLNELSDWYNQDKSWLQYISTTNILNIIF